MQSQTHRHRGVKATALLGAVIISVGMALLGGYARAGATTWVNDYPYQSGNDPWGYPARQCTSFVAWRISNDFRYPPPQYWGNAGVWDSSARNAGYTVNNTPSVGSILQLPPGVNGASSDGHVGIVLSVGQSTVHVEDYNWYETGSYLQHDISIANSNFIHIPEPVLTQYTGAPWNAYNLDAAAGAQEAGISGRPFIFAPGNVFAISTAGDLMQYVGSPWSSYDLTTSAGSSVRLQGNPFVISYGGSTQVFVESLSGHLMQYVGAPWSVYDLTAAAQASGISGSPSVVVSGSSVYVYVRGANGNLIQYVNDGLNNRTWNAYDVSGSAQGGGSISGQAFAFGSPWDIFVVSGSGHLMQYVVNAGWVAYDLTASAGSSATVSGQPYVISYGTSTQVFVTSGGGHLFQYVGAPWAVYDLTAAAQSSTGTRGSPYVSVSGSAVNVFAQSSNNHLVQYVNDGSNGRTWNSYDLSGAAGQSRITGDPVADGPGDVYVAASSPM